MEQRQTKEPLVLLEKKDRYAIITLNRPEQRNAMNRAAQQALADAVEACYEDCHAVVITGAGVAFCAGVDLKERRERLRGTLPPERITANRPEPWLVVNRTIREHPAIFIAAVNGYALAGGLSLTNSCDLAIASERAQFGIPETGVGMFPGLVAPLTAKTILPKHLAWMVLTAQRIDAYTAERWGIVSKVVPHEQLLPEAEALAQRIAGLDPVVLDWSKKAVKVMPNLEWDTAAHYGGLMVARVASLTDAALHGLDRFAAGERNPGQGGQAR
ncbi:MAG: enoyl-CoA hydratase/isomerase family protein [Chloroflexi bacterium]|nr:enoyl-CoA hydratase/isomerase family protein [Chloroflexota bacterium]